MATQQNQKKKTQTAKTGGKGGASSSGASTGGTAERDENYALISVLYHALQGAETYSQYVADAQRVGDQELVRFLEECRAQENERAVKAKQILAQRLEDEEDEDEDEEDDEEDEEDEDEE